MNEKQNVSICLPTLNARGFIEPRLQSILVQTCQTWELVVCDSSSDDGTWECLQQFKGDSRVRLFQVPREGMYAGWNECLKRCRGEYVYIATADDTMRPDSLERMVSALEAVRPEDRGRRTEVGGGGTESSGEAMPKSINNKEHTEPQRGNEAPNTKHQAVGHVANEERQIDIAVCDFDVIDDKGKVLPGHLAGRWSRAFYGDWMGVAHVRDGRSVFLQHAALGMIWWTMTAVMFRRSLLDRIGLFRTDRGSQADEEWEMRAALASDIVYVPEKLATWRVSEQQATSKLQGMNRTNLECLISVLNDSNSGVPEEWKRVPGWKEKICRVCRTEYRDSLGLYRNVARYEPKRFLRGVEKALKYEPGFLVAQALRGFSFSRERMSLDPVAYAHELIELFGSEWPPREV